MNLQSKTVSLPTDRFQNPKPNSDGLLNCLRQPRLLCNEPPKSMRLNFKSAFQVFCHPDCFRTSGTESVGLAADARGVMVFAIPSRLFHRDPKLTILTRTWYHGTVSS